MVLVAKDGGATPVATSQRESRDSLFRLARENPDVQAALKRFPGAEILNVKEPDLPSEPPTQSEPDEESR